MIDLALEIAAKAHLKQLRKGTDIPYITHPVSVGFILTAAGCEEELVAAGLLHDTVEDASISLEFIKEKFGERVAEIVKGCSEPDKSMPWEERKQHTIEALKSFPDDVRTVTCADKLQNIRSILRDYQKHGDEIWKRFNKGKTFQKSYYTGLVESLGEKYGTKKIKFYDQFKNCVEEVFGK